MTTSEDGTPPTASADTPPSNAPPVLHNRRKTDRPDGPGPEPVIDLRSEDELVSLSDLALTPFRDPEVSVEDGELIIDLRELAPHGRIIPPLVAPSGRPPDLLPHHRLVTITGGDLWMTAEAFVYERYVKVGFTHESSTQQVEELARWADQSRFHAILNEEDEIVGTIRSIFGTYDALPVSQFERIDFDDADPLCELSSLVVDPSVKSSGVLEHLFRAGWADATRLGASAIIGLIDRWLYHVFRDTYALPFVPIGRPHFHMGGNVIPITMGLRRESMAEIGRNNPEYWLFNLEVMSDEEVAEFDLGGLATPAPVRNPASNPAPRR